MGRLHVGRWPASGQLPALGGHPRWWRLMGCEMSVRHLLWDLRAVILNIMFHPDINGPSKYFQVQTEKENEKRRRENNNCVQKQIPGCAPTRAGSRPLNQRRCLEGAPIKQILKVRFIHNTSRCYFVLLRCNWFPPNHCTAVFGSLYSAFCSFGDLKSY